MGHQAPFTVQSVCFQQQSTYSPLMRFPMDAEAMQDIQGVCQWDLPVGLELFILVAGGCLKGTA